MKNSGTLNKDEESLTEERIAELGLGCGVEGRREATDDKQRTLSGWGLLFPFYSEGKWRLRTSSWANSWYKIHINLVPKSLQAFLGKSIEILAPGLSSKSLSGQSGSSQEWNDPEANALLRNTMLRQRKRALRAQGQRVQQPPSVWGTQVVLFGQSTGRMVGGEERQNTELWGEGDAEPR